MGNCSTCCGKSDTNEVTTEKSLSKIKGVSDYLKDDLMKNGRNNEKLRASKIYKDADTLSQTNELFSHGDLEINN